MLLSCWAITPILQRVTEAKSTLGNDAANLMAKTQVEAYYTKGNLSPKKMKQTPKWTRSTPRSQGVDELDDMLIYFVKKKKPAAKKKLYSSEKSDDANYPCGIPVFSFCSPMRI